MTGAFEFMKDIRLIPFLSDERVETGPTQFGTDWPCVVVRGDDSFYYAMQIRSVLLHAKELNEIELAALRNLQELFESCNLNKEPKEQDGFKDDRGV